MSRVSVSVTIFLGLLSGSVRADEPAATHRWIFDAEHIAGRQVTAVTGQIDGEVVGNVKLSSEPPAIQFDGRENRMEWLTDGDHEHLPKRECSFETWVTIDVAAEWGAIVGAIQDNGDYERGWLLGYRDTKFCFAIATGKKNRLTYLTAPDDFVLGVWYHVAGTYDGTTMRLFVDGEQVAESTEQSGDIIYPPKTWFAIGAYHDDNELYPMAGKLAELSIYRQVIAPEDIAKRFDATMHRYPSAKAIVDKVAAWPTYMHDIGRSGVTHEAVSLPLYKAWEYRTRVAPAPAWPPPANQDFWHDKHGLPARVTYDRAFHVVSEGERVYFGSSSEDQVFAISLATGEPLWSFFAEGPVRLAPTVADGRVYFGADDGIAYCLNATAGKLVWRYEVSESDRRLPGNGRVISLLPIRSSILIDAGQARFAAGLFPLQGTYQYALDMQTGAELAKGKIDFSPQGYMQRRGSSMTVAQGRAPKAKLGVIPQSVKTKVPSAGSPLDEFPFAQIRADDVRFAGGKGQVAAFDADEQLIWSAEVTGDAYSLAVVDGSLLVSTDQGIVYRFTSDRPSDLKRWDLRSRDPDAKPTSPNKLATAIIEQAGVEKGYCLLVGDGLDKLATDLAKRTQLNIVWAVADEEKAAAARMRLDEGGVYVQVTVHSVSGARLPYASGMFNLLVCRFESAADGKLTASELRRLLCPGKGTGVVLSDSAAGDIQQLNDWAQSLDPREVERPDQDAIGILVRRPPLSDAGQWTHIYGGIGNTSCSEDTHVNTDLALQWFGEPGPQQMLDRHHRTVPPLYIDGHLFVPGNDRVYGVDAYNGTVLWNVEVANSRRVAAMRDAGSMAASKEYLYVAAGDRCYGLAAQTGAFELNIPVPPVMDGKQRDWGYVAYVGDQLIGSATKPEAGRDDHSREQIKETYYDFVPLVTSDAVFAMNRHDGKQLWQYEASAGAIVNATITSGGGRMYFVESTNPETLQSATGRSTLKDLLGSGSDLVALELETGKLAWRTAFDFSELQHQMFLSYSEEKLVAVGTKNRRDGVKDFVWYDLHGFDAISGKHVWQATQNQRWESNGDHGEQDHHPTIVGDTVYQQPYAYDLHTGERRTDWQFARGGHGCGALSASASTVFFRAANPTMCDLATGKNTKVTQVSRPGCWINMIPAGGLLMIPEASSGCTCNFPIQASMVFAPRHDF